MAGEDYCSLQTSSADDMNFNEQDNKDVSKVFAYLRAKLNAKEKELLELQRAQPCLLAPDSKQIETLIDALSSLQLSTQEGSFIFASSSNHSSLTTSVVCSTGVDSIKTLPSTAWLSESSPVNRKEQQQHHEYRLPMITHLLSLPVSAYIAASSNRSIVPPAVERTNEPSNRLPMVSQLLSMPLNAFKSSSNTEQIDTPVPVAVEDKKDAVKINSSIEPSKSIFETEPTYSKEHWLKRSSSSTSESDYECIPLDLDAYIEQTSDKMRRLHSDYLEALEKLKTPPPTNSVDSSQVIQSMYPQMFDRIQPDLPSTNRTRQYPSNN